MRFHKLDTLNLQEVEHEIDILISIAGENPSDETIQEVTKLVRLAKSLGTKREW